jgi:hypothetical protein
MTKLTWGAIGAGVAALAGGAITFAFAASVHMDFPITPALAICAAVANLAAIPFFLIGLSRFKAGLRRAYFSLSIGVALFGLAQVQLPVISLFNLWFWADTGGIALPYLVAGVFILISIRQLAGLLNLHSRWTSLGLAALVATVLGMVLALLPHVNTGEAELVFDISIGLIVWDTVVMGFAGAATWHIARHIGRMYVQAMRWLAAGFLTMSVGGVHYIAVTMTMKNGNWYFDESFVMVPFIIGAFILVKAGYEFNLIGQATAATTDKPTLITVITYLADLTSNPQDINSILDRLRQVTAKLRPGQSPDRAGQQTLVGIYHDIERYLVEREPLRQFTPDGIHQEVRHQFELDEATEALIMARQA